MLEPGLGVTRPWFLLYRVADRVACVAPAIKKGRGGRESHSRTQTPQIFWSATGIGNLPNPSRFHRYMNNQSPHLTSFCYTNLLFHAKNSSIIFKEENERQFI